MENEVVKEFSKKILSIQEEERHRISRDLHDETGQLSVSLGSALNIIEKEIEKKNFDRALQAIKDAKAMLSSTIRNIKMLVLDIRPAELDILGLPAVLREHFSYYTKTYPLKIKFKENLGNMHINEQIAIGLYRVIQEALNNIVKHSKARAAEIDLLIKGRDVNLIIEDDGIGFDPEDILKDTAVDRLGIRGIKERIGLLNGKFSIQSKPARKGTKLTVLLPLDIPA